SPLALVVFLAPFFLPFPAATVIVAPTPPPVLPSFPTRRSSDLVLTAVPAAADWLVGLFAAIVAAAPAVPVAVKITGLPASPPAETVRAHLSTAAPSIQRTPSAAPLTFVVCVPPVTLPLPAAGVN